MTPWTVSLQIHLWTSPGKNMELGCHFVLQGIFPTQGLNPSLLHSRQIPYWLSKPGKPTFIYCCLAKLPQNHWLKATKINNFSLFWVLNPEFWTLKNHSEMVLLLHVVSSGAQRQVKTTKWLHSCEWMTITLQPGTQLGLSARALGSLHMELSSPWDCLGFLTA